MAVCRISTHASDFDQNFENDQKCQCHDCPDPNFGIYLCFSVLFGSSLLNILTELFQFSIFAHSQPLGSKR